MRLTECLQKRYGVSLELAEAHIRKHGVVVPSGRVFEPGYSVPYNTWIAVLTNKGEEAFAAGCSDNVWQLTLRGT